MSDFTRSRLARMAQLSELMASSAPVQPPDMVILMAQIDATEAAIRSLPPDVQVALVAALIRRTIRVVENLLGAQS